MKPIAFIIITYNRPQDCLALARNIAALDKASALLEDVVILNNASNVSYDEVKEFISIVPHIPFRYHDSPENLGVSKGRNVAMQQSEAPYFVLLDDDTEIANSDALEHIVDLFEQVDKEGRIGIFSFKVLYYDTKDWQINTLPHKNFDKYHKLPYFETYYYAGGAHAIRREAFAKTGFYPPDFAYGMEEYDLAYRILNAGYRIAYSDRVVILHKESPFGRKPREEKLKMMWVNKSKVAWRYLPRLYYYSTAFLWSLQYLREGGWNWRGWLKGWKNVMEIPRNEKRQPVSKETLDYMRKVEARLWY